MEGNGPLWPLCTGQIYPRSVPSTLFGQFQKMNSRKSAGTSRTLGGSGDVLPKQLLVPHADRGVAMDQFPLTVFPTKHDSITEGYLRAIG
jgi:hypothetical protein